MKSNFLIFNFTLILFSCFAVCQKTNLDKKITLSKDFKNYWFSGKAEVSSYNLNQSRYGKIRKGKGVLIFLTEDFLKKEQVKTNKKNNQSQLILKLNQIKKFKTGIYTYSIMNSVFTPLQSGKVEKISSSIQEWCGNSYAQLNYKGDFKIITHSYFEGEADRIINLKPTFTENGLWTLIRLSPQSLPLGHFEILPDLEMLQLLHFPIKTYKAKGQINKREQTSFYILTIPELQRTLNIEFNNAPPYIIKSWKESFEKGEQYTTTAKLSKTLSIPYWNLNKLENENLRNELNLN